MKPSRPLVHTLFMPALLALWCSGAAQAQGIWRCGPQGNSFSDRPCAEGQALTAARAPSAQAVQQATEVARREAALATQLRAERLAAEQQFQRTQAAWHRNGRQGSKAELAARAKTAGHKARRAGQNRLATPPHLPPLPLRVAAGPRAVNPQRQQARPAAAGVRTSAAAAHGFPARRD